MTKNEILTLVQDIARSQAETDTISAYYDEAIEELGKLPDPPLVERALFSVTAGTHTYDYPTDAVELLHVFYGSNHLMRVPKESLEAYSKAWRGDTGTPIAYKTDHEDSDTFRLYPNPTVSSTAPGVGATELFGDDFPANSGAYIYSDKRETGISDMIGMYVAFRILYKEFARTSNHQDMEWAMLLKEVANVFFQMGVMRHGGRKKEEAPTAA